MADLDAFAADLSSAVDELSAAAGVPANGSRRGGRARKPERRTKAKSRA
jgi:hypothetical protein